MWGFGRLKRRSWLGECSLCCLWTCFGFLGYAGDDLAHDYGVADEFAVDGDVAAHFDCAAAPVEDGHFDAELVAWSDGAAEAGVFSGVVSLMARMSINGAPMKERTSQGASSTDWVFSGLWVMSPQPSETAATAYRKHPSHPPDCRLGSSL